MFQVNDITFRKLYDEHFKNLVFFAMRFTVDKEPAEDIAANKFVKLWELRAGFDDAHKCKAFLYKSVANECRNYCKRSKKTIPLIFDIEETIEAHEINMAVIARIKQEIENLPPVCKSVFKKRIFDQKKMETICKELNMAYSTVDNQYQRARKIIIKNIGYEII